METFLALGIAFMAGGTLGALVMAACAATHGSGQSAGLGRSDDAGNL